ncbi:MAG TPA: ribosome small subunit-dependent GTPase A [Desulfitobacteriaceae bacterium]|jgi:ribosome biogenesis GTPase|nr:ribosome small subunit-dependent GTPase A [Desulfitobacteriaceae bacterium]
MIQGIILKGYSGFYYVFAQDRVWECSLRGRFRIQAQDFFPGDRVEILPAAGGKASIEKVEPRRNILIRPPIVNVDQALLVFARTSPDPDYNFLDRLLIQVSEAAVKPVLVVTKLDLLSEDIEKSEDLFAYYQKIGYEVYRVSNINGQGIEEVSDCLTGKISVLAGQSGVGKSSLLNALCPDFKLKTGKVSNKIFRGRHTTRHVELMVCAGGLVADTPGFSSLYLPKIKKEDLAGYFPEFESYQGCCRFSSCLHNKEPDCAVKEAVRTKEILAQRYEHYLLFLQELIINERRY